MCNMWHEEGEKSQIHEKFKNLLEEIMYKYLATNFVIWRSITK